MKITDESKPGGLIKVSRIEIPQAIKDGISERIEREKHIQNCGASSLERVGPDWFCNCCGKSWKA